MAAAATAGGSERRGTRLTRRGALLAGIGAAAAGTLPASVRAAEPAGSWVTRTPASSADNTIQPADPAVIPLSVRGAAGQQASLQQWQDASGNVLASLSGDGTRLRFATPSGPPMRVQSWEQASPDGRTDRILSLTYNREIRGGASYRDDESQPSVTFQMESWWNSTAEISWDIQAPDGTFRRPFSLSAAYDGTVAGMSLGLYTAPGAGGVELWGGTRPDVRNLRIYERQGGAISDVLFAFYRGDRSSSFAWRGGGIPRLIFPLDGRTDAISMGPWGVLKFAKPIGGPILSFQENGPAQLLLASYPLLGDTKPRFALYGDGRHEWAPGGSAPADVNLYRAQAGLLRSDALFQAYGGVATKVLTRPPTDADFAAPVDGLFAVDGAARRLYVRSGGVWRSLQLTP